ncbi:MAG: YciI family protein [Ignavibacteriae bacterium]|nr:YciI family protein [Ignavibacteriota bacterium]
MKFAVFVKATKDSEAGILPSEQMFAEMMKYNEELSKAGIILAGDGLQPSSKGVRVKFSSTKRIVTDGPFTETKELVAGYWIWECKSKEEAIEWVKKCPNPMPGESEIEIRPIYGADDLGEGFTPELQDKWQQIKAEGEARQKK